MKDQMHKMSGDVGLSFQQFLEYNIFSVGKYSLSVYEILAAILVILLAIILNKSVKKLVYNSKKVDIGRKFAVSQILFYIIFIIATILVLKSLGVDISPLLLGSGAILVGIGLGLQNLFLDFISGIIILFDRSVMVGDVIDIGDTIGEVKEIRMRTTTIETRERKSVIYPNSLLTKDKLTNFSHDSPAVIFVIEVGVHYDTDIDLAVRLLEEAARENKAVLQDKPIFVRLENFGDSSLDLKLYYYSVELFAAPQVRSDLRMVILKKFRDNNVNIPYPIRTLEFPSKDNNDIEKEQ
ncbi:Mechanosensitive ion channel [Halpernia humi]|uniref:Mechanosensitive ion channel n=2 Tax=Halpernia humi TaxID=493375 RepID=A0A1H5Y395_9FLAO|nr:Mechanosensitive ion channel [Halpernia humi]